jgi:eukaryotic-like serine/threonine-protein kinase
VAEQAIFSGPILFWSNEMQNRMGQFELLEPIGTGGMADVFLARRGEGELCAVKCLHPSLARDPAMREAFADEARLLARLRDPHIVRFLESGVDHGTLFLAMEYAPGRTLEDIIDALRWNRRFAPLEAVATVADDLLAALHVAHEATDERGAPLHLVHLDVSPQNLIICPSGTCKLTDSGIARSVLRDAPKGEVAGKVPYLAPEQLHDASLDRRVDIWAAALVIYELAALRQPLAGQSDIDTLRRIGQAAIPPLSTIRDDVPPALDGVLQLALTRPAEHRFENARAFRAAVRHAFGDLETEPGPRALRQLLAQTFPGGNAT